MKSLREQQKQRRSFKDDDKAELPIFPFFAFLGVYAMLLIVILPGVANDPDVDAFDTGSSDDGIITTMRNAMTLMLDFMKMFLFFDIPGAPGWIRALISVPVIACTIAVLVWTGHKIAVGVGALIPFT